MAAARAVSWAPLSAACRRGSRVACEACMSNVRRGEGGGNSEKFVGVHAIILNAAVKCRSPIGARRRIEHEGQAVLQLCSMCWPDSRQNSACWAAAR